MKKIRILIADDHALMRLGLKSMIGLQPDMEVVGEAANGQDAVRQASALRPDVVIMDLMMPKLNGADATKAICEARPQTNVVMLTSYGDAADLGRAISNGAVGVQMKDAPTEDLLSAVRKVMAGETAIASEFKSRCEDELPPLTPKQSDILEAVARGYANKDIAKQFGITEVGVKKHLRLIFAKLGAANRSEAVAIALRRQLLKL